MANPSGSAFHSVFFIDPTQLLRNGGRFLSPEQSILGTHPFLVLDPKRTPWILCVATSKSGPGRIAIPPEARRGVELWTRGSCFALPCQLWLAAESVVRKAARDSGDFSQGSGPRNYVAADFLRKHVLPAIAVDGPSFEI